MHVINSHYEHLIPRYFIFVVVFEIVLRVCEGTPWQEALMKVMPSRKGALACDQISTATSLADSNGSDVET